ncbi:MAG: methyltransferase domain-containing protein [Patescibacteria group bacterium]
MPFLEPKKMVQQLGIKPGMVVVDLGSGSGVNALALAQLPARPKVYAIEVQKDLLEKSAGEARLKGLANLEVIWADIEKVGGTKLREDSVDLALLANTLFQLTGKYTAALEIKRMLKPGGRLAVVDWSDSFGGTGPAPTQVITAPAATAIFREAGFREERTFPAGDHHWGIIFIKPETEPS